MNVREEKDRVVELYVITNCAGDAPLTIFVAVLPVTVIVFIGSNVVLIDSVECADSLLRVIVKEVLPLYVDAMEYAALMVVHPVYVSFTQKGSIALVVVGVT